MVLTGFAVILKGPVKTDLLGVKKHTHPLLLVDLCLGLEVVSPVVGHHVEAQSVLQHGLHLTRQQVDRGGCFALVRVANLQESIPDLTSSPLPDVPQTSLRSFAKVSGLAMARFGISPGLVERVLACRDVPVLE